MKKNLNSFKQSANLSSRGAMESGDHFKNGANPKSLTNRNNHLTSEKGADRKQRFAMKKIFLVAAFIITLFVVQNANGQIITQQANENTLLLAPTDENLIKGTPVEIISTSDAVFSSNASCTYGVGRYSGEVSIHYYNNCDQNIQIGFKYKFKKCCPSCDCTWSSTQTDYATLSRNTKKQNYKTLKQGSNQNMTYRLVDYWKK